MKNLVIIFSLSLFVLSSCSSLRKSINNPDRIVLNSSNFELMNGKYKIQSFYNEDSIKGNLYWYIFDGATNFTFPDSTGHVVLDVIDEKNIHVSYLERDIVIKTKKIKGKLKDGYFVFRKKYSFIPFIITNFYGDRQFRIGILYNGNLITDYNGVSFGTVMVIIPFYNNEKEFGIEFKKIQGE